MEDELPCTERLWVVTSRHIEEIFERFPEDFQYTCTTTFVAELCGLRTFGGVNFLLVFICAQSVSEFLWDIFRASIQFTVTCAIRTVQKGTFKSTFRKVQAGSYSWMIHHANRTTRYMPICMGCPRQGQKEAIPDQRRVLILSVSEKPAF
eukprot:COSAG02_NODE_135_length_34565_cov_80.368856_4_plen_150_part_00